MEIKSLEDKKMEETGNDSLTTKINDKFHFKMITSELFPKTQKEIEIIASSFSQSYDNVFPHPNKFQIFSKY